MQNLTASHHIDLFKSIVTRILNRRISKLTVQKILNFKPPRPPPAKNASTMCPLHSIITIKNCSSSNIVIQKMGMGWGVQNLSVVVNFELPISKYTCLYVYGM